MKKVSLFQKIILSAILVLSLNSKSAMAFGFLPPMPPDFVNGIPAYPGEFLAKIQAGYDKYQMIKNLDKNTLLKIAGGVALGAAMAELNKIIGQAIGNTADKAILKAEKKIVGPSGKLEKNKKLNLKEYETREKNLKEAFFTQLFFVYPEPSNMSDMDYNVLKTMHKAKMEEFRQDIIVNTYLTGRLNEDFLVAVEKTLHRLELCANNLKADGKTEYSNKDDFYKNCKFFGHQMRYIPSGCTEQDSGCDTDGDLGAITNLYIISTISDRILRIIEDLTATEGQFRVAQLMVGVEPLDIWSDSSDESGSGSSTSSSSKKSWVNTIKDKAEDIVESSAPIITDLGEFADKTAKNSEDIGNTGIIKTDKVTDALSLGAEAGKTFGSDKKPEETTTTDDSNENHTDANDYINKTFKFAYNELVAHSHAQMLKNYNRDEFCRGREGKNGCPLKNSEAPLELVDIEDTSILEHLIPAENAIEKAVKIHNYKNNLPHIKIQYRNYLQAVENHKKALQTLRDSEQCNIDFIARHNGKSASEASSEAQKFWGKSTGDSNDHDNRPKTGLSYKLIKEYQDFITDKILEETSTEEDEIKTQCNELGFYKEGECPTGQKQTIDDSKLCKLTDPEDEMKDIVIAGYYECAVETVTADASALQSEYLSEDGKVKEQTEKNLSDDDVYEYMKDSKDLDDLNKESLAQNERTWYIGSKNIIDLANDGTLVFTPWNDQKDFQKQYMFNKYRNILSIIKTIDKGDAAMKIVLKDISTETSDETSSSTESLIGTVINYVNVYSYDAAAEYLKQQANVKKVVKTNSQNKTIRIHYKDGSQKYITQTHTSDNAIKNPNVTLERFKSLIGGNLPTASSLINHYFNERLYGNNFKSEMHDNNSRRVAADLLDEVMTTRKTENNNIANVVNAYSIKIKGLNNKLETKKTAISKYNKELDKYIQNKNDAEADLKSAKSRIEKIDVHIAEYTKRMNLLKNIPSEVSAIETKITVLEKEKNYLNGNSKEAFPSKNLSTIEESLISELLDENGNYKYIPIKVSEAKMNTYNNYVETTKKYVSVIKEEMEDINEAIETAKEEFATDYIEIQEKAQDNIEEANAKYEALVYNKTTQMIREKNKDKNISSKQYESNNLETTIKGIREKKDENSELKDVVKEYLKNYLSSYNSKITNALNTMGVTGSFDFPAGVFGDAPVSIAAEKISEQIIEQIIDDATNKIVDKVQNADSEVAQIIDKAQNIVKTFTDKYGITPQDNGAMNENSTVSVEITNIQNYSNEYIEKANNIIKSHMNMIEELQLLDEKLKDELGIEKGLLGVPDSSKFMAEDNKYTLDQDYFVGLPARSTINSSDEFASRDYMLPKEPMTALPPLREIFYFGPTEYDEIPFIEDAKNDKNGHPVISSLLMQKDYGNKLEFMPEIWRHLLATPNLREDKKYQQAFVERSYPLSQVEDGDEYYRTEIARGGIFPCKVGSSVIDVYASNNKDPHKNIKFVKSKKTANLNSLPTCKEVELSSNYIIHKLADEKSDNKNNNRESLSSRDVPEKTGLSELSQFIFIKNKASKTVKIFGITLDNVNIPNRTEKHYRRFHEELWKYYLGENNKNAQNNNITHRKIDLAIFKRNIFGDFLNSVSAEIEARRIKENYEHNIRESISDLCEQYCETKAENKKPTFCPLSSEDKTEDLDYTTCVNMIMADGLADSTEDKKYYFKNEFDNNNYTGLVNSDRNWYAVLMADFDSEKEDALREAKDEFDLISKGPKEKIQDRYDAIKNSIKSLEKDKDEIASLDGIVIEEEDITAKINEAKANLLIEFDAAEKGIEAMKNQGKTAAYCPVY